MEESFGKYRLIDRLAFGGMAEVFMARVHGEAGFSKPVVIKRLHPRLGEDAEFATMLIDEARITAQLSQSNICQVLDLGSVGEAYFIAMEHIAGEDLRTIQSYNKRAKRTLPIAAAIFIMKEVLAGLDYAHRKEGEDGAALGIVHRDVSPQNILISYDGEVKVIDFGIAKARQRLVETQIGVIKGKFRYMSPEQALGRPVDASTDIFAAGVVFYELLRGSPHSLNIPDTEVLERMREAKFEPIERPPEEVPEALVDVVFRALNRSPAKRYASAGEFRRAIMKVESEILRRETGPEASHSFGAPELSDLMYLIFPEDRIRKKSGLLEREDVKTMSASRHANQATTLGHDEKVARHPGLGTHRRGKHSFSGQDRDSHRDSQQGSEATAVALYLQDTPPGVARDEINSSHSGESGSLDLGAENQTSAGIFTRSVALARPPRPPKKRMSPPQHKAMRQKPGLDKTVISKQREAETFCERPPQPENTPKRRSYANMIAAASVLVATFFAGYFALSRLDENRGAGMQQGGAAHPVQVSDALVDGIQVRRSSSRKGQTSGRDQTKRKRRALRRDRKKTAAGARSSHLGVARKPPLSEGRLVVTSIREGDVYINDAPVGRTPKLSLKLPPGRYIVRIYFRSLGLETGNRWVVVRAKETSRLHFDPTM